MPLLRPLLVTLVAVLLTACARNPVVKLYDGPDRSDSQVVTVRVPTELEVFTINGKKVEDVNTFFATGYKDLKLTPGHYEILAYYKKLWDLDADNHDIIKSDPANFIVDGKAGEHYRLTFDQPQNVEQARALKDNFSGWVENTRTGEKVASKESGLVLKRGLLASITGTRVESKSSSTVAPRGGSAGPPATLQGDSDTTKSVRTVRAQRESAGNRYLDTLKAQWKLATPEERRAFLQWISQ